MVSFQFPTQSQSQLYEIEPHCQPMPVPCYKHFPTQQTNHETKLIAYLESQFIYRRLGVRYAPVSVKFLSLIETGELFTPNQTVISLHYFIFITALVGVYAYCGECNENYDNRHGMKPATTRDTAKYLHVRCYRTAR